jgi:hypothetical protein
VAKYIGEEALSRLFIRPWPDPISIVKLADLTQSCGDLIPQRSKLTATKTRMVTLHVVDLPGERDGSCKDKIGENGRRREGKGR